MAAAIQFLLALIPFVLVTFLAWARSTQYQQHSERSRTTLGQRDLALVLQQQHIRRASSRTSSSSSSGALGTPAAGTAATAKPTTATAAASCSPERKPYHTILTATSQVYQKWQCRVMYFHWKKQRALDPAGVCTELTGFTRLVANGNGDPDGIEGEIPSYFVKEYDNNDLMRFHGYRVINRPYSVVQFLQTAYWREKVTEEYVYIAETDHILTQPLPNRAKPGSPMAYIFNYMGPNPAHANIIKKMWPEGGSEGYKRVQSIGPSPVVVHKNDLESIAREWKDLSEKLKVNPEADSKLGWVIEMWGYAIAAAKIGLRHQEFSDFQVEPGALSSRQQLTGFPRRYWLFHYTYQFEYMLDGKPCQPWTIGEFSLDKRHFSDENPPYPLPQPPEKANAAAFYLINAFNEAMGNISGWRRQPPPGSAQRLIQSVYGRRRLEWFSRHQNGFATEKQTMPLVGQLGATDWICTSADAPRRTESLQLSDAGDVNGLGGTRSRWGTMNDPTLEPACPVYACIFIDGSGQQLDAKVGFATGDKTTPISLTIMSHKDLLKTMWTCTKQ